MKKLIIIALLFSGAFMTGCLEEQVTKPSAERQQSIQTERLANEAHRQAGMPAVVNFQERKLMKMIMELRDSEDLICYAYLYNRNTGDVGKFLGKCLGYGLPYSVQFTSPEKLKTHEGYGTGGADWAISMPQPEANGLYMPEGLSATWLMLIDPKTKEPRPVYVEPEIIVSPFPLH